MKRIGRAIGLTAAAALTVTLFAGCSGTTEPAASEQADAGAAEATPEVQTSTLSGTISTNGSTSMESVISALKEVFEADNPGVTITYDATGSSAGITAAMDGSADIGLSSRTLKETETGLTASVVALDGIAIIVNAANPVEDLTVEQIAGLFKGEITNWSEVGGNDMEVTLVGREAGSGTRDGFESIVGVAEECKYDQEMTSTGAVISSVATNEYAIGYASLSSVGDTVKSVTVGGVPCTEETILDGTYAIQRPFVIVTNDSTTLSEAAQAFVDFALSPEAKEVIEAAGAVQP
ncbi:MAG: phosphate ABC transporter substrate-binding protein [Oscillospiraceae bacterium]|nr:phosphate ABC transporter substrate-binding protein [Oscillospiraceae bacterium]